MDKIYCLGCEQEVTPTIILCYDPSGLSYICQACHHWHLGFHQKPEVCAQCGEKEFRETALPFALCPNCTKRLFKGMEEVAQGGVYWACQKCHSAGYVEREHSIAKAAREATKIVPPEPVETELPSCPFCDESEQKMLN